MVRRKPLRTRACGCSGLPFFVWILWWLRWPSTHGCSHDLDASADSPTSVIRVVWLALNAEATWWTINSHTMRRDDRRWVVWHTCDVVLSAADLFVRMARDRDLVCSRGHESRVGTPTIVDWRDRDAVALLAMRCPTCGEHLRYDDPILVLRPGDPIAYLLSLPTTDPSGSDLAVADKLLAAIRQAYPDLVSGAGARTDHTRLPALAFRYSGFALSHIAEGTPLGADFWLDDVREQVPVPDVVGALNALLDATDDARAARAVEEHPVLIEPAWGPVFATMAERVLARSADPEAQRRARSRLSDIARRRWPVDPVSPDAFDRLDPDTQATLAQAVTARDLTVAQRRALLSHLVQLIQDWPSQREVLVEYLTTFATQVYEASDRDAEGVAVAVSAGTHAVPLAREVFGDSHPMTLIAVQNYGAALLDHQLSRDVAADRELAIQVLEAAAKVAAMSGDPILSDILQNLGGAYAHRQQDSRAENQRLAEEFCRMSLHIVETVTPNRTRSIVLSRIALASILRERRTGDRYSATREAYTIYRGILDDSSRASSLQPRERLMVWSNLATNLYQSQSLLPRSVSNTDIAAAAWDAVAHAKLLPPGNFYRIRALSNMAGILGSQSHANGSRERGLLASAVELAGQARAEAREHLGANHPELIRIGANYASLLGMPVYDESSEQPAVHQFDAEGAKTLLRELLATCPPEKMPAEAAVMAYNLGRHLCGGSEWDEACAVFRTAVVAMDTLYRNAPDPESRLAELGAAGELSWSSLLGCRVSASLQAKRFADALAIIESSRGRLLADALRMASPPPAPGPTESDGMVLYVGVSELSSWVILVPPKGRTKFHLSGLTAHEIRPAVRALRRAEQLSDRSKALEDLANLLRARITGPAYTLLSEYGVTDIGIVATGLLSSVPVHVLSATDDGECMLDLATVRYLPSAAIARHIESMPPTGRTRVLAISDDRLSYAPHESGLLDIAFDKVEHAPPSGNRRQWLLDNLSEAAHLLISAHAIWLDTDPLRSRIELDEHHALQLAELLSPADSAPAVVVFSTCESGSTSEPLADEMHGFGTAMLLNGSRGTIVTNWRLGGRVCALVLAVFYQEIAHGADLASALRAGQLWLAKLTVGDLIALGEGRPAQGRSVTLPRGIATELAALRFTSYREHPEQRLYVDPATWGGFSYFGTRVYQEAVTHGPT